MNLDAITETLRLAVVLPEIILVATILMVLMIDAFSDNDDATGMVWLSIIGTAAAGIAAAGIPVDGNAWFTGLVVADKLRRFFMVVLAIAAVTGLMMSRDYLSRFTLPDGEYLVLYLSSLLGMFIMVTTTHLGLMFLGLEMMSMPLYALTAFRTNDLRSGEGALKYFFLGSAAGAMFLLGSAFIYGQFGSLDIVQAFAAWEPGTGPEATVGLALLLTAVGFKLAWVPFHPWSPDAYEGAPAPVTAFMSTAVKVAVVGAGIRIAMAAGDLMIEFQSALEAIAIITMVAGNLIALTQDNIKRMLAYSSIAHAGYLAIAFMVSTPGVFAAASYYVLVYALMNIGAFGVLIGLSRDGVELESFEDLRGLGRRRGGAAVLLALFFASLSGIPPLAGFTAKLFLFGEAVRAGATELVVVAVLASAVGAYYYLRPLVLMFLEDGEDRAADTTSPLVTAVSMALAAILLVLGLLPGWVMDLAHGAASQLLAGG